MLLAPVPYGVKTRGSTPDATALLFSLGRILEERFETDEALRTACATLRTIGFFPLLRIELVSDSDRPRVVCADRRVSVPQWSTQDVEVLRSVGIASEQPDDADPGAPQPRRRQSR
ncbi:MAG: hypothetical protein LAO05_03570 [Acidobacteriia bacterium]|nr:hypothetical protein [Terriglobia bacterium]